MGNEEILNGIIDDAKMFSTLSNNSINRIVSIVKNWVELNEGNEVPPELLPQIIELALGILDSYDPETGVRITNTEKAVQIAINKIMYGNELETEQIVVK